jgi:hypothetical protein
MHLFRSNLLFIYFYFFFFFFSVQFTLGMVTVQREKSEYFSSTLTSLLTKSSEQDHREMSIVIMLGDRNETYNQHVLGELKVSQGHGHFAQAICCGSRSGKPKAVDKKLHPTTFQGEH